RERLRELALAAFGRRLAQQRQQGDKDGAIWTAMSLVALDPLQEAAHRDLMSVYVESGRRGAALRQYQICVDMLRRELGVEPEPETKRLYQAVVQDSAARRPDAAARSLDRH